MITNVVCYAELNCSIDLIRLANECADVVYKPGAFPGAIWSDERAGGNCKVFSNGKMVVNGRSRSVCETETRLREYATLLREMGWNITVTNINLATMSATYKLDRKLNLETVVRTYNGSYEPGIYPAALFIKETVHFTCFHTGPVLITGVKSELLLDEVVVPTLL